MCLVKKALTLTEYIWYSGEFGEACTVLFHTFYSSFIFTNTVFGTCGFLTLSTSVVDEGSPNNFSGGAPFRPCTWSELPSHLTLLPSESIAGCFASRYTVHQKLLCQVEKGFKHLHQCCLVLSVICCIISAMIPLFLERNPNHRDWGLCPCPEVLITSCITLLLLLRMWYWNEFCLLSGKAY